jgi:hypothetical protein
LRNHPHLSIPEIKIENQAAARSRVRLAVNTLGKLTGVDEARESSRFDSKPRIGVSSTTAGLKFQYRYEYVEHRQAVVASRYCEWQLLAL